MPADVAFGVHWAWLAEDLSSNGRVTVHEKCIESPVGAVDAASQKEFRQGLKFAMSIE